MVRWSNPKHKADYSNIKLKDKLKSCKYCGEPKSLWDLHDGYCLKCQLKRNK